MNFEKALTLLKKGNKITRREWKTKSAYLCIENGKVKIVNGPCFIDDILAKDWELYKEIPELTNDEICRLKKIQDMFFKNSKEIIIIKHFYHSNSEFEFEYTFIDVDSITRKFKICSKYALFPSLNENIEYRYNLIEKKFK